MNSFLDDNYGVADARREQRVKWALYGLLATAIIGGGLWFLFRDYKEEGRVKEFLTQLERKEYKTAYGLWGCTDAAPCRDYKFERFMEDWGAANAASVERTKVKSCTNGIIQLMRVKGEEVRLYVDRSTLVIAYAPWPVCNPRIK